jgi:hypothetical protein
MNQQKKILIFRLSSAKKDEKYEHILEDIITNIYQGSAYNFSLFEANSLNNQKNWIKIADKAENILTNDCVLHSYDIEANIPCFILKKKHPNLPWIHSFHYSFLNNKLKYSYYKTKDLSTYFKYPEKELEEMELNTLIRADYLIFNSYFTKDDLFQRYKGFLDIEARNKTSFVIPNGYDNKIFKRILLKPNVDRKIFGLPSNKKILLFLGGNENTLGIEHIYNLGYDQFINKSFVIVIVGNPFINFKITHKVWDTLIYEFPELPNNMLNYLINISDYVLLPSIYDPFGQSGLVSMVVGRPLTILSKINTNVEYVLNHEVLLDDISINSIVKKIKFFERNEELKNMLIKQNMEHVRGYKWKYITYLYKKIYDHIKPLNYNYHIIKQEREYVNDNLFCRRPNQKMINKLKISVFKQLSQKTLGKTLIVSLYNKQEINLLKHNKCFLSEYEYLFYESKEIFDTIIFNEVIEFTNHKTQCIKKAIEICRNSLILVSAVNLGYINKFNYKFDSNIFIKNSGLILESEEMVCGNSDFYYKITKYVKKDI